MARLSAVQILKQATAKDFRGGWNTTDSDLNISSRFLPDVRNMFPDSNGRLRIRYGVSSLAECDSGIKLIAMEYFNGRIIGVSSDGRIVSSTGTGTITVIWNTTIAAALPGAPAAWGATAFASFTQFAGVLVICNGVDKPLSVSAAFAVSYLVDAGTGVNTFVPRAKFCTTHNNYLVLASVSGDRSTLHIGAKGVAGTFVGAPAPNDAVTFNVATHVNRGSPDITGLASFRDKLIVTFDEAVLAMNLGDYNSAATPVHIPAVVDTIENYGAVSHACITPLGDDVLFLDIAGIASIKRALITGTLSPVRESALISEEMQASLGKLTLSQLANSVFSIHDRIQSQLMFFVPKDANITDTTDNDVYVFCFDTSQRFRAMTYYDNMPYRCGCRSTEGRVFFGAANVIYYYHNLFDPAYGDLITTNPAAKWTDLTGWTDGTFWTQLNNDERTFTPFEFTLPWTDFRDPMNAKYSKYLKMLTEGPTEFTVSMYADRQTATPDLSMLFTSSDTPTASVAGTRPSTNEQLYAWPSKFTRAQIKVSGESKEYFGFIAVTLLYYTASIRR